MKISLSDGREVELHDASGNARIGWAEAYRWAVEAVEKTIKQVRAGEERPYWYCSSGDTFVLAMAHDSDSGSCIDVWLFKITEHGWTYLDDKKPQDAVASLRSANTRPDAVFCAQCGTKLKDPGMGPAYKHCPKCEP